MAKKSKDPVHKKDEKFPLPEYPAKDDIYKRAEEKSFEEEEDQVEDDTDLDIPGTELDNKDEIIGEEDEENNYYSLGGDNHEDLEEDKGDR